MKAITKTIIASAMLSSTILFTSCVSAEERQERKLKDQLRKLIIGGARWNAVDVVKTVDHLNNNQEIVVPKFDTRFYFRFNAQDDNYFDITVPGSDNPYSAYYALKDRYLVKCATIVGDHIEVDYDGTMPIVYNNSNYLKADVPIKVKGTIKFDNIDSKEPMDVRAHFNIRYTTTSDSIPATYGGPSDVPGTGTILHTKVKDHHDFTESFTGRRSF